MARSLVGLLAVTLVLSEPFVFAGPSKNPSLTSKLVDFIAKKNYDAFTNELSVENMDPNQPDSKGRLPLMEAVRSKDLRFVDALIQFGATANSRDPASGSSPVSHAMQTGQAEVARLLLAYGADLNSTDKSGKKPRDFQPSPEIASLVKAWDKDGAMAFEDPPGTWVRSSNDEDQKFWYNTKSEEARWNTPPSCSWQRVMLQGQPNRYVNGITGQQVTRRPAALSWRFVRQQNMDLWYNWVANFSQIAAPDEVPAELLEEAKELKNVRWFNPRTGEFSWEDPRWHTPWRIVKEEQDERPYYFNVVTGESTWEAPEDLAWQEMDAKEPGGRKYWYNARTGESTWDVPNLAVWERHATDL